MFKFSIAALAAAALSACASNPSRTAGLAQNEWDQLRASCDARGGILVPSGRLTGRPPLDNVCRITDPTRISPSRG